MLKSDKGEVRISGTVEDLMVEYSMLTRALLDEVADSKMLVAALMTAVMIEPGRKIADFEGGQTVDMSMLMELLNNMDEE